MADLFGVERSVVTKHIQNIFRQGELKEKSVCANFAYTVKDGKSYQTTFYNLDTIIAVGYRVNAKRGTQFRTWATNTLKEHLLKGYTLHQKRLVETGLTALEKALQFIKNASNKRELTNQETQGLLEVITGYAKSWLLLKRYDEQSLLTPKGRSPIFTFVYGDALNGIDKLKTCLMDKGEASDLFGREREKKGLDAILNGLEQTFGEQELYPTLETKASHLLYFIIKIIHFWMAISALFLFYLFCIWKIISDSGRKMAK